MASSSQGRKGTSKSSVYHEKQSRWRCGLHAVNALLRRKAFTPTSLDEIADSLVFEDRQSWFNPHRSALGLGDYDANVLLIALERQGLSSKWVSNKDEIREFLRKDTLSGFLVNVKVNQWIHKVLRLVIEAGRHWVAVVRYPHGYFLVDSKAQAPSKFASEAELLVYMENVKKADGHILAMNRLSSETGKAHAQ